MYFAPKITLPHGLIAKLTKEQEQLRSKIILQKPRNEIKIIAGCDSALIDDQIFSVFVMFSYPELEELEVQTSYSTLELPYISGFLAFREMPNLLKAYEKVKQKPDLIMVDGSGQMHPRRMGIATHLGIILNKSTFGVAKKKLVGSFTEPNKIKGSYSQVIYKDETVALALRSKDKVKPIFVSPGQLCDMDTALEITLATLKKHKLPEPTRIADLYSKQLKSQTVIK